MHIEEITEGITYDIFRSILPRRVAMALQRRLHQKKYQYAKNLANKMVKERNMTPQQALITALGVVGIDGRELRDIISSI